MESNSLEKYINLTKMEEINEHIRKIIGKSKYTINEASFSLVTGEFEDDDSPLEAYAGPQPVMGQNDSTIFEDEEELDNPNEVPEMDAPADEIGGDALPPLGGEEAPEAPMNGTEEPPMEEPIPEPEIPEEPSVDELQNDIIKLNISAMQQMNSKVASLEKLVSSMDTKFAELNKEVEEVREPTNVEKLTSRKDDSHPFYYGLNDMWDNNHFQARRDETGEKGMRQLEDGSFIADFDDINKFTDYEVKDSFDI